MAGLTSEVIELITRAIDSVESIEIMMLLRRSPKTFWAAAAVAEQLGMKQEVAAAKLDALQRQDILKRGEVTGAFRYAPAGEELKQRLEELATEYTDRRANVINTIYSANLERLRAFSNAFRVK
jgi:predicted transcriptional regulator